MKKSFALYAIALAAGATLLNPVDLSAAQAQRGRGADRMALAYVGKAAAGDLYEIESSRLAMQRARRPQVRDFARMLIADHSRMTQQVSAAARQDGMMPPRPMLEPAQRGMIRQLQRTGAAGFDRAYLDQQVIAHQQALALHRDYARAGRGANLRRAAGGAVPVVQGHLGEARRLARGR